MAAYLCKQHRDPSSWIYSACAATLLIILATAQYSLCAFFPGSGEILTHFSVNKPLY